MFVAVIINAEDVDTYVVLGPYVTSEQATRDGKVMVDRMGDDIYRFDVVPITTLQAAIHDEDVWDAEAEAEDAEYNARYEMSANAVDGLDDGMQE